MIACEISEKSHLMSQVIEQDHIRGAFRFTWGEKEELKTLGDIHRLPVGFINDVAYVGLSYAVASWTIKRAFGRLWVARFADGAGCLCDGWHVAVDSIADAMARVRADGETEGWNR